MAQPRLLGSRAGITTWYHPQHDGTFVIETRQDVEPILETNKATQIHHGKNTRGKDIFPAAKIPIVVQYEWLKRYGIRSVFDEEYWPLIRRLLNSNEWRYLRTSEIHL
jgi:hypothetical protein